MAAPQIPVVDLFAGPGGLGEGFSSVTDSGGNRIFDIRVSIEKDYFAHQTLMLRALFRAFPHGKAPDCYYEYLRGNIGKQELFAKSELRDELEQAQQEARCATLGKHPANEVDEWIRKAIGHRDPWVLIGGPPCQAYSMVGRARLRNLDPSTFENDERHFLYKEYLRIIRKFKPAVFVMENVKGLLSSTHGGSLIFTRIREDLSRPEPDLSYEMRSFVRAEGELKPADFVIEAENHGIPQRRHRVILFGVRGDLARRAHKPLVRRDGCVNVHDMLSGMPHIRSRISRGADSFKNWLGALREARAYLGTWECPRREEIEDLMAHAVEQARFNTASGARFVEAVVPTGREIPEALARQLHDPRLGGMCQHEARSHMREDLHRYLFAAFFSEIHDVSLRLAK